MSDAVVLEFATQGDRDALLAVIAKDRPDPFKIGDVLDPVVRDRIGSYSFIDGQNPAYA